MEALEKLREALPRVGDAQHRSFAVDVSKSEEVENVAARIIDACEHVDVLVNSAGEDVRFSCFDLSLSRSICR